MQEKIKEVVSELFGISIDPLVSVPEEQFGDLATNVAMQIANQVGKNPRDAKVSTRN
jgi:arginyl-tRNA synthetase